MIIRKQFSFCGAHIVRDCSSKRCSRSQHGHNYIVEVFLTADGLDIGQMIVDFGLLKSTVGEFIDSFDHAYSFWDMESEDVKSAVKKLSDRWVEMPCSPSAEAYSLMFLFVIDKILKNTTFVNGEKNPRVHSVRVHETATGYAEAFLEDLAWVKYKLDDIHFSDGIKFEWKDKTWFEKLLQSNYYSIREDLAPFKFINPTPEHQIRKPIKSIDDIKEILEPTKKEEAMVMASIKTEDLRKLTAKYQIMITDIISKSVTTKFSNFADLINKFDDINHLASYHTMKDVEKVIDLFKLETAFSEEKA